MKSRGVKTFTHQPVDELPKLLTENIDGKRFYISPTGEKYPSITTVLSKNNNEGIIAWRKKVGEAKANHIASEAARRGTAVHKLIEDYLNNEELSDTSGVLPLALFTVMKEELDKIDKKDDIKRNILEGKMKKFINDNTLLNQPFVKDPSTSLIKIIKDNEIISFTRYEVGEGIEKKSEDFAQEVYNQIS